MSGGEYEYIQYQMCDVVDQLEFRIKLQSKSKEEQEEDYDNHYYNLSEETIEEFKKGLFYLKMATIYIHRIDWLLSGDDGEDGFHERLQEDLLNEFKPKI